MNGAVFILQKCRCHLSLKKLSTPSWTKSLSPAPPTYRLAHAVSQPLSFEILANGSYTKKSLSSCQARSKKKTRDNNVCALTPRPGTFVKELYLILDFEIVPNQKQLPEFPRLHALSLTATRVHSAARSEMVSLRSSNALPFAASFCTT